MPRDGSGTFTKAVSDFVNGVDSDADDVNTLIDDIGDEITNSVDKDGQTAYTGEHDWNGNKMVIDVDGDSKIGSDTDDEFDIDLGGATEYTFSATDLQMMSNNLVGCGTGTFAGIVSVDDTTQSTSTTTGSIHTDGGLGVVKDAFIGGDVDVAGANGITFDGGSNYLGSYEEGSWTPGIEFGGASTGITYTNQVGVYTKIGNRVLCSARVILSDKGSATGDAKITGLPFTSINSASAQTPPTFNINNLSFADFLMGRVDINATTIALEECTNAGVRTTLDDGNFANNTQILVSFYYEAA